MRIKKILKESGQAARNGIQRALSVAPAAAVMVSSTAGATSVVSQINTLSSFVLSIIQAAGVIVTAWGVFEFANGYQSHDGTQQTTGLKRIIAGLIMVGAGTLMSMLGVS